MPKFYEPDLTASIHHRQSADAPLQHDSDRLQNRTEESAWLLPGGNPCRAIRKQVLSRNPQAGGSAFKKARRGGTTTGVSYERTHPPGITGTA